MIWVVVHLNQYRSEHNIGSVHFGLCWQAWVVVCEFWCFGNSLSKGVHSRMALWHYGLIHEKFQWWRNYCEIFDVLDVLAIVWCDSWRWCYAEHWACDAKVGSWCRASMVAIYLNPRYYELKKQGDLFHEHSFLEADLQSTTAGRLEYLIKLFDVHADSVREHTWQLCAGSYASCKYIFEDPSS